MFWRALQNRVDKDSKVTSIPGILYGSDTWIVKARDKKRLQEGEMKFLRNITSYMKIDPKQNDEITEELNTFLTNWQKLYITETEGYPTHI